MLLLLRLCVLKQSLRLHGGKNLKVIVKNIFLECLMVRKEKERQYRTGLGALLLLAHLSCTAAQRRGD